MLLLTDCCIQNSNIFGDISQENVTSQILHFSDEFVVLLDRLCDNLHGDLKKIDEVLQGSKWVLHKGTRYIYINDKNDDAVPPAKPKDTGNNNGVDDANKDGNSGKGQEGEDKHNK